MAVEVLAGPVVAHRGAWVGVPGGDLHVAQAHAGDQQRHRLSRAGNRRINRVLHIMAVVQLRHDTPGRAYHRCRLTEGKTPMEAIRSLKRRLSDVVYRQMIRDANATAGTGPGGHAGATLQSSAADPNPEVSTSEQSLPGPAEAQPRTQYPDAARQRGEPRLDARCDRRT